MRCDCGFDFESGTIDPSHVAKAEQRRVKGDRRKRLWLWLAVAGVLVALRVASPPRQRLSLHDAVGLLIFIGAAPLAWTSLAAALLHAALMTRATWWLHHGALVLVGGVVWYCVLYADFRGDSPTDALARVYTDFTPEGWWWWVPFGGFLLIGAIAAGIPLWAAWFRQRLKPPLG